jgi:hypothetical protein
MGHQTRPHVLPDGLRGRRRLAWQMYVPFSHSEQDAAAGGRRRRLIDLGAGLTARASIRLKNLPKSRRIYAYLRYSLDGKTITKYVGDVTNDDRGAALRAAWKLAHNKGLLTPDDAS